MSEYEFTLAARGTLTDETVDALYEAGCDDMTFSESNGVVFADVTREAPDFFTAARSAIEDIESVPGLRVQALDAGHLVTMPEIAQRLGRTRQSVHLLVSGERGGGGFPPPAYRLQDRTRLWLWSDVARWAQEALGMGLDERELEIAESATAINGALAVRLERGRLSEEQRRDLRDLVEA